MKNDDECCKGEKLKEKRKFKRKQTGKNILKVRIWKKYKILQYNLQLRNSIQRPDIWKCVNSEVRERQRSLLNKMKMKENSKQDKLKKTELGLKFINNE